MNILLRVWFLVLRTQTEFLTAQPEFIQLCRLCVQSPNHKNPWTLVTKELIFKFTNSAFFTAQKAKLIIYLISIPFPLIGKSKKTTFRRVTLKYRIKAREWVILFVDVFKLQLFYRSQSLLKCYLLRVPECLYLLVNIFSLLTFSIFYKYYHIRKDTMQMSRSQILYLSNSSVILRIPWSHDREMLCLSLNTYEPFRIDYFCQLATILYWFSLQQSTLLPRSCFLHIENVLYLKLT